MSHIMFSTLAADILSDLFLYCTGVSDRTRSFDSDWGLFTFSSSSPEPRNQFQTWCRTFYTFKLGYRIFQICSNKGPWSLYKGKYYWLKCSHMYLLYMNHFAGIKIVLLSLFIARNCCSGEHYSLLAFCLFCFPAHP